MELPELQKVWSDLQEKRDDIIFLAVNIGDEGLLAYVNPGVKTSDYDKMILTPPVLARKPGRADAEAICDYWADRISEFLATEHSKTKK